MNNFDTKFNEKFEESVKDVGEIPKNAKKKAIATGVAAGTSAAVVTVAGVAAVGTASTGTAIASLSGAAATNAAIAAIGGGSVAVGGGGILLGTVILASSGAIVALAVGYGAWKFFTRKNNNAAVNKNITATIQSKAEALSLRRNTSRRNKI